MTRTLVTHDGQFSGYASMFNVPDRENDIVMSGAFEKSLSDKGTDNIRLLFQHDPAQPIGHLTDIFEDKKGLFIRGKLLHGVHRVSSITRLLKTGAIDGLSIGFRTLRASAKVHKQRRLWEIDLWEISIVTFPMHDKSRILPIEQEQQLTT